MSKRWFFDVQWSDCPKFVELEVRKAWSNYELGNDNYIFNFDMSCEDQRIDYPYIYGWLKHNEVSIIERDVKFTIVVGDIHFKTLDTTKIRESIQVIYYPNKKVDIFPRVESIIDL